MRKAKVHKPKGKLVLFTLIACILALGFYLFSHAFKSANNILAQDITFRDLVSKSSLKQQDGITNILLLGKGGSNHPGGQLTDSIILMRIKQSDKSVAMVSFPRDLQVTNGKGISKLNEVYSSGFTSEKDQSKKAAAGAKSASDVIQTISGVPVHYYITVDFIGFKNLVDALGGVTVDVTKDLYDPYYPKDIFTKDGGYVKTDAYTTVDVKKGRQNMNGELALKYARSRETTSDFDRSRRQQELMYAIKEKAMSLGVLANPKKVTDILDALGNNIKTNLSLSEIKEFMQLLKDFDSSKVTNKVIDNNPKDGLLFSVSEGGYYLKPKAGNFKEVQNLVQSIFSTSTSIIEGTEVELYNASGVNGAATRFANTLKADDINVSLIEKNDKVESKTIIYDGSSESADFSKLKKMLPAAKVEKYTKKGFIKVVLGSDYGK